MGGWPRFHAFCLVCALLCLVGYRAAAQLPPDLATAALAEHVPSAFGPASIQIEDFRALRVSGADPTLHVWLEPGSLRWVRVGLVIVPRAVLRVEAPGARGGSMLHGGFAHPLIPAKTGIGAAIPVALLSSETASIVVQLDRGAEQTRTEYALRFAPRAGNEPRVHFDSSCSPYGVHVESGAPPQDSWVYIGCRLVRTSRQGYTEPTLELHVLWDNVGGEARFDTTPIAAASRSFFFYRVAPAPAKVRLEARGASTQLAYRLPPVFHAGFLGAGLGPYYFRYKYGTESVEKPAPLFTVYAGYSFDPAHRLVYFSAAVPERHGFIEQGLYYWTEQTRFFDNRISMNLLLGGNLLIYKRGNVTARRLSAPQGLEFIFRDFAAIGKNLTAGAFFYPFIAGSAYYNGWLRWGSSRFFGEANFLFWQTPHSTGATRTTAAGFTFGMPLLRFL